ncbi:MAG: hypothetical protein HPY66_0123 [Firmicutes bacterium]|nr:hypothetical protein [Bacillota bacterium]
MTSFRTRAQARLAIFEYIEVSITVSGCIQSLNTKHLLTLKGQAGSLE